MFNQLGLIGCGLMGGSFALALKRANLVKRVIGYSKSPSTTEKARQLGVIDQAAESALLAVSGSDIVPTYCAHHRDNPAVKVFMLGAAPGIAQKAMQSINARVGREVVVGAHSPSMKFVDDEKEIHEVIRIINDSGATCLIIGLGAPKQEIWIVKYRHAMPNVRVYMGVGATIDYEAGVVKRAPRWMTRSGLEWLYRITTEPRRYWRRYLRDMEYFWLLLLDAAGLYRSPMQAEPVADSRGPIR